MLEVRLQPHPPSVGEARRRVRELLVDAHREDLLDTCVLLVSEVVTNALLHAGTVIELRAELGIAGVRVEVGDGSPHLPSRRRYAATAGTGRGMQMLESLVDDWGVDSHLHGKTVWFLLSGTVPASDTPGRPTTHGEPVPVPRPRDRTVIVDLVNMPLLLHAAWQEHAEALLREYLLASLDSTGADPIQLHADATDAIAVLEEHTPRSAAWTVTDELFADGVEPHVSATVRVPVPLSSVPHFDTLDRVVAAAAALAEAGQVLTPPVQPAVDSFRRWLCGQVLAQSGGDPAEPWAVPGDDQEVPFVPAGWDPASVSTVGHGRIAANSASQIIAVSPEAARILGYDDGAELVGRRIVSIVPARLRQAHVAGFTMYLLVGRRPMLGTPSVVPALRRDGTEVEIELLVHQRGQGPGGAVLLADLRRVGDEARPAFGVAG